MPIIISRDGSSEPVVVNALSPEQRQALWEHVVKSWCSKNEDQLRAAAASAPAHN